MQVFQPWPTRLCILVQFRNCWTWLKLFISGYDGFTFVSIDELQSKKQFVKCATLRLLGSRICSILHQLSILLTISREQCEAIAIWMKDETWLVGEYKVSSFVFINRSLTETYLILRHLLLDDMIILELLSKATKHLHWRFSKFVRLIELLLSQLGLNHSSSSGHVDDRWPRLWILWLFTQRLVWSVTCCCTSKLRLMHWSRWCFFTCCFRLRTLFMIWAWFNLFSHLIRKLEMITYLWMLLIHFCFQF